LREDHNFIKIKILEDPLQNDNKSNIFSKLKKIEGSDQNEIDVLTPTPAKIVASVSELDKVDPETIIRLENKVDKLTSEINKCYDVITLLFNTIMSSSNNTTPIVASANVVSANVVSANATSNTINDITSANLQNDTFTKTP
jgi:hypothetical protein